MTKTLSISLLLLFSSISYSQDFKEKHVEIGELKGTLLIPKKKTKTAILMISGSGPTDRNGNSALGYTNNSLKMVSEAFAHAGYAVLKFDKRGIAESKSAVSDPASLRFDEFIEDTNDWASLLINEGYKKIIIAGHSQGSLVGILAAQENNNVVALISIAGLAEDAGTAIVKQLGAQSKDLAENARINIDSMRMGYEVKRYSPMLISLFGPQIQGFLKSYMIYNPSEEIKKLNIPILIVNGTTDLQVDEDQAKKLKEAYPEAELMIIDNMNHVLKDVTEDDITSNMATYNNPDLQLSDGLMEVMIGFVKSVK